MAFVLVQISHYLKITVSQLLEMIDRCHLFIFFYYYLSYLFVYIYIYIYIIFIKNVFMSIFISSLVYYCISDFVIYVIYIDLMRKRCQLINVDVDVGLHFLM